MVEFVFNSIIFLNIDSVEEREKLLKKKNVFCIKM